MANDLEIGDVLFYDNVQQTLIATENTEENLFDKNRFKPIGVIIAIAKNRKTIKVISSEFIQMHIDVQRRNSEKTLMKFVNKMLTDKRFHFSDDIKYYVPDEADFTLVTDNMFSVINGLKELSTVIGHPLDSIIASEIVGFFNNTKSKLKLMLGGIGPDLLAKIVEDNDPENFETYPDEISVGWSPYTGETFDDYLKRQEEEQLIGIVQCNELTYGNKPKKPKKKETCSLIKTYSDIKKEYKNLDLLEFFIIPFAAIRLE